MAVAAMVVAAMVTAEIKDEILWYVGIDGRDIVIVDENNKRFVL